MVQYVFLARVLSKASTFCLRGQCQVRTDINAGFNQPFWDNLAYIEWSRLIGYNCCTRFRTLFIRWFQEGSPDWYQMILFFSVSEHRTSNLAIIFFKGVKKIICLKKYHSYLWPCGTCLPQVTWRKKEVDGRLAIDFGKHSIHLLSSWG